MFLPEYINTQSYRRRVAALLAEQKQKLSEKQFSQFAAPFVLELQRLDSELANYEQESTPTLVSGGNCCSFTRMVAPLVEVPTTVWLCGSLNAATEALAGKYVVCDRLLYQDAWNSDAEPATACEAA